MVGRVTASTNQQVSFEEVENSKNYNRCWKHPRNVILCGILLLLLVVAGTLIVYAIWTCRQEPPPCQTEACQAASAQLLGNLNRSVAPCEDFFSFSCGNWITTHPVPPGKEQITVFETLWENNHQTLKMLLEEQSSKVRSSTEEKARMFYRSCMNTTKIEELGAGPLIELIEQIGGWSLAGHWNVTDLNRTLLVLMRDYHTFPFFRAYAGSSPSDPHINIIQIDQPEFWMLSQNKEKNYAETLRVTLQYLQRLGELSVKRKRINTEYISAVFAFASTLMRGATPMQKRIETKMLFQMLTIEELQAVAPSIDWFSCLSALFHPVQLNKSQPVYVHDLHYIKSMSEQIGKKPSFLVNIYMILYLVQNLAPSLDSGFEVARQKLMTELGNKEAIPIPRWQKCVDETNTLFQPVVGAMFVRKTFSEESRRLAEEMIAEIKSALQTRIDELDWIDEQARRDAKRKVISIKVKLGYPEDIMNSEKIDQDYADYDIHEDTFFQNVVKILSASRTQRFRLGLSDPLLETSWKVGPESVRSYYSMQHHEVVFPAGMFQPPFFHTDVPRAMNFGGIGVFMAHEILHAFHEYVDSGSMCQECEMMLLWHRAQCMVTQYSQYTLHGAQINGSLTLQENVADCGGLETAYQAYENWLWKNRGETVLPHTALTPHQLFFTNFAQVMCGSLSNETVQESLVKNPHSPSRYRVIGPLSNSKGFAHHFRCPEGSIMNPPQKCHVW